MLRADLRHYWEQKGQRRRARRVACTSQGWWFNSCDSRPLPRAAGSCPRGLGPRRTRGFLLPPPPSLLASCLSLHAPKVAAAPGTPFLAPRAERREHRALPEGFVSYVEKADALLKSLHASPGTGPHAQPQTSRSKSGGGVPLRLRSGPGVSSWGSSLTWSRAGGTPGEVFICHSIICIYIFIHWFRKFVTL